MDELLKVAYMLCGCQSNAEFDAFISLESSIAKLVGVSGWLQMAASVTITRHKVLTSVMLNSV